MSPGYYLTALQHIVKCTPHLVKLSFRDVDQSDGRYAGALCEKLTCATLMLLAQR